MSCGDPILKLLLCLLCGLTEEETTGDVSSWPVLPRIMAVVAAMGDKYELHRV